MLCVEPVLRVGAPVSLKSPPSPRRQRIFPDPWPSRYSILTIQFWWRMERSRLWSSLEYNMSFECVQSGKFIGWRLMSRLSNVFQAQLGFEFWSTSINASPITEVVPGWPGRFV